MLDELHECFLRAEADDDVRVMNVPNEKMV